MTVWANIFTCTSYYNFSFCFYLFSSFLCCSLSSLLNQSGENVRWQSDFRRDKGTHSEVLTSRISQMVVLTLVS